MHMQYAESPQLKPQNFIVQTDPSISAGVIPQDTKPHCHGTGVVILSIFAGDCAALYHVLPG